MPCSFPGAERPGRLLDLAEAAACTKGYQASERAGVGAPSERNVRGNIREIISSVVSGSDWDIRHLKSLGLNIVAVSSKNELLDIDTSILIIHKNKKVTSLLSLDIYEHKKIVSQFENEDLDDTVMTVLKNLYSVVYAYPGQESFVDISESSTGERGSTSRMCSCRAVHESKIRVAWMEDFSWHRGGEGIRLCTSRTPWIRAALDLYCRPAWSSEGNFLPHTAVVVRACLDRKLSGTQRCKGQCSG